jgi:hypothetical protein
MMDSHLKSQQEKIIMFRTYPMQLILTVFILASVAALPQNAYAASKPPAPPRPQAENCTYPGVIYNRSSYQAILLAMAVQARSSMVKIVECTPVMPTTSM